MACKMWIEIPFFIFIFALMFGDAITSNWIIFKTCHVTLGYNETECALLGSKYSDEVTKELEEIVQPHASLIIMVKMLVQSLGAPIVCFFLGPWSDRFGRKPMFLITITGIILQYCILTIICTIPHLSPWFILLSSIPLFFTGGVTVVFAGVLCYINDKTLPEARGTRIGIFYAISTIAVTIAILTSVKALRFLGYFVTYLTATSCLILAWLIIFAFIEESVQNPEIEDKFKSLFRLSLVKETVVTTFKRRHNYDRSIIFILIIGLVLCSLMDNSNSIMFLYLRQKFHWSLEAFTLYNTIMIVTIAVGSVGGIYILHNLLKFNESIVLIIGFMSIATSNIFSGLAGDNWHIYTAGAMGCLYGTVNPMSKSLISKLVSPDEYGKIFSFIAVCESFIGAVGSPLFTFIYNQTLTTYPGIFLLVVGGIAILGSILATVVSLIRKLANSGISYEILYS